jgi:hypothetical protein
MAWDVVDAIESVPTTSRGHHRDVPAEPVIINKALRLEAPGRRKRTILRPAAIGHAGRHSGQPRAAKGPGGLQILAWAMYDWGNSAFATTVMAGFFPVVFKEYFSSGVEPATSTARLGLANSIAGPGGGPCRARASVPRPTCPAPGKGS